MLKSICPFSNGYRKIPPNLSSHLAKLIDYPCPLNYLIFMLWHWVGPRGIGWLPHPVIQSCLGDPSTKLFEKGTHHLCCPVVSCLFSVPCLGWFVKHVFRLIGSHIHLTHSPAQGLPIPCCLVPCVGLSKCCLFTHTSERLISNVMHALYI